MTQEREEVPVASSILRIDSDRLISFQSHERFTILSEGFVISRFAGIHDNYGMMHPYLPYQTAVILVL